MKAQRGSRYTALLFFNLGARCGWVVIAPAALPLGRDPVPVIKEAGWTTGPVWTGAGNLATTRIRIPDRAARSESLYRLRCTGLLRVSQTAIWRLRTFSSWWRFLLAHHSGRLIWRHVGPRLPPLKLRDLSILSYWYEQTGIVLHGVTFRL
jgi:hypothetical protein